jgi:hypothetical protein
MVLYYMQKDDNCIFKNNQDRRGISYLSKHLSYIKRSHLLASPAKLTYCELSPFYKPGATHYFFDVWRLSQLQIKIQILPHEEHSSCSLENQPVNAVSRSNLCLLWETCGTYKTPWENFIHVTADGTTVTYKVTCTETHNLHSQTKQAGLWLGS